MPSWAVYAAAALAGAAAGFAARRYCPGVSVGWACSAVAGSLVAGALLADLTAPRPAPDPDGPDPPAGGEIDYYVAARPATGLSGSRVETMIVQNRTEISLHPDLTARVDKFLAWLAATDPAAAAKLLNRGLDLLAAAGPPVQQALNRIATAIESGGMTPEESQQVADQVNKAADGLNTAAGAGAAP